MERFALSNLISWKNDHNRKPLVIRGARQVGKTWLMKEFGKSYYKKTAYINFENNERIVNLFESDFDIQRIMTGLQIEAGVRIDEQTLIVFDEVQNVPKALTSLKYFYENAPQYHLVAAGSLLGVTLHPSVSFPVGSVQFLDLYPLSFSEFLNATDNSQLLDLLQSKDFGLIHTFKTKYIDLLKEYYFVGGLPEVVNTFVATRDMKNVRNVQKQLLSAYSQDFSKHAPLQTVPRIRMVWNSIPAQLAKENRKFIYGLIKEGARAREFDLSLQWLADSGLIYQVYRITKPDIPLSAYQDQNAFKLFIFDIGLLTCMSGLDPLSFLEGNSMFEEFKGALTEQFVLQELIVNPNIHTFYWSADRGQAEVDFIFQKENQIIPLEVKASENLRSKSLQSYFKKFHPKISIRTSLSNFRKEDWLINLPLYALPIINDFIT